MGVCRLAARTRGPAALPKGSITMQARLVSISPHAPALASELLSNFPEVMLHPAPLPRRSVRYVLADLMLLVPKPPAVLATFVLLAPAWSTLRAPLPVWPTLYGDHVCRGDRSGTERGRLCRCRQGYADSKRQDQRAHFCLHKPSSAATARSQTAEADGARSSREATLRIEPSTSIISRGTESLLTLRWRRQSRANPSLETRNSLLAGKIQGNSSISASDIRISHRMY